MKIYILSDSTYASMMEKSTPGQRLILETMHESGRIIVSPYLPVGEKGYVYDGPEPSGWFS